MQARSNVPLNALTTLQLGGIATHLNEIEREEDIVDALGDAEANAEQVLVLGRGSNVVIADEGFAGLVVHMATRGVDARTEGDRVVVEVAAGEDWDDFVARAVADGWCGLECMSGIPGLVGATPIQNVGAYGQEVRDTIAGVRAYDRFARCFVDMDTRDCHFAYRSSVFKRNDRFVVTTVRFSLRRGAEGLVRYAELGRALSLPVGARAPLGLLRETVLLLRRGKGMVLSADDPDSVSVGSFFVNPVVDDLSLAAVSARVGIAPPSVDTEDGRHKIPAAWLVEQAGFVKGWGDGRVGISRKHALALVNRGGASTRELLALARMVRDGVRARFGVTLEPEPVLVGCSWEEQHLEGQ